MNSTTPPILAQSFDLVPSPILPHRCTVRLMIHRRLCLNIMVAEVMASRGGEPSFLPKKGSQNTYSQQVT